MSAQQLDFWLSLFRPLLKPEEAAFALDDVSVEHVVALTEEGKLRGVDIANRVDPSEPSDEYGRRCIRVYRYSIEWLMLSRKRQQRHPGHPVVETIFQHGRPHFLLKEAAYLLNCTEKHMRNLAIEGPKFGATGSNKSLPRIPRAALKAFLEAREINAVLTRP